MDFTATIDLTIPATVPRQKIASSAKNKDWYKDNALYWENRLINKNIFNQSDKIKMKKNCNMYYHNILDTLEVGKICNPYNLKDFKIPLDFKHYKIENPKIQTLKGEELKRRFDWKVYVSNRDAVNEKEDQKKEQYAQFVSDQIKATAFDEESAKKDLEKLQDYLEYDWQELRELTADQLLHHYVQYLDLKTQFSRAWEHSILNSEEIMSVDEHNGKPVVEACDPKTIYWLSSPENPYIDDSDAVTRAYYVPLGQIIDYYYDYLTPDEIEDLQLKQNQRSQVQAQDFTFNQYYHKTDDGFLQPDVQSGEAFTNGGDNLSLYSNYGMYNNFNGYFDREGNIRVVHTRWKSMRKVGELTFFDEDGTPQSKHVDEAYKIDKSKGETIEWKWINEAHEITRIGERVFVKGQIRNVQYRKLDNISYCSLGYVGTRYNNGIYDVIKDFSIRYDAYMWRTEQAMIKAVGKIGVLDLSMIPDGWDLDMWMHFAVNMGWAVKDSFKEGKKGAAMGKLAGSQATSSDVINLEQGQFIQQNMMMLQYLEGQMDKVIGINGQRQGMLAADAGLQVTREAAQASANITESYFALHDNIKLRTLRALLEVAKWCLRDKVESIQYVTSEMSAKVFEIDGNLINEAEYGILVNNADNDAKTIETLQEAVKIALQTGAVDLVQMMDIFSSNSTAAIKRKVEKSVKLKQKQEQANIEQHSKDLQAQMEHEAQLRQEELAERQADRDLEKYKIDQDNATKIQIKEMDAFDKIAAGDANANNIPDPLDIAAQALDQQKHASDVFTKNQSELNKSRQHAEKIGLEREKLKSKEMIEKQKAAAAKIEDKNQIALANKKHKADLELANKELAIEKIKARKAKSSK